MENVRLPGLALILVGLFLIWHSVGGSAFGHGGDQSPHQSAAAPSSSGSSSFFVPSSGGESNSSVGLGDGAYYPTGEDGSVTLNVNLSQGHAIFGQSYGFGGVNTGCQVWMVAGPFHGSVQVNNGEYFVFTDRILTSSQERQLLSDVGRKQASQHYGCSLANQRISELGG